MNTKHKIANSQSNNTNHTHRFITLENVQHTYAILICLFSISNRSYIFISPTPIRITCYAKTNCINTSVGMSIDVCCSIANNCNCTNKNAQALWFLRRGREYTRNAPIPELWQIIQTYSSRMAYSHEHDKSQNTNLIFFYYTKPISRIVH